MNELLKQCQKWHKEEKYELIIEELEAIDEDSRTPELDLELARAYNNYANCQDKDLLNEAVRLLTKHEDYFIDYFIYHYRLGYAYYYLDNIPLATKEFEKAYNLNNEDNDTKELLLNCYQELECPRFRYRFKERVDNAWKAFLVNEEDIRNLINSNDINRALDKIDNCLKIAFGDISFEISVNKDKNELILSPEGMKHKLYPIVYFVEQMPKEALNNWVVRIGKIGDIGDSLKLDGISYSIEDIYYKVNNINNNELTLDIYSSLFIDDIEDNLGKIYFIVFNFLDHILGEITTMKYIRKINIIKDKLDDMLPMLTLREYLELNNYKLNISACDYLNEFYEYHNDPVPNSEYWREDIISGTTNFIPLLNEYNSGSTDIVDEYYNNGIVAGFISYSLLGFNDDNDAIYDLRDNILDYISKLATTDVVEIIGTANGMDIGYIDFIAWDFSEFMDLMLAYFANSNVKWSVYHAFRPNANNITLDTKNDDDTNDNKIILKEEQIDYLNSCLDDNSGYFNKMYDYLDNYINEGVELEKFTELEARENLDVALWYSYICNNIGTYDYYIKTVRFMPYSLKNALTSGTWFYRYSCALVYVSRLKDALRYARFGALVDPEYPWVWLLLGKLEAHFGNKERALEAVNNGLTLIPDDYEFLTLKEEINNNKSIEEMECHWINPESDYLLQTSSDDDEIFEKQNSTNSIRIDYKRLKSVIDLFNLNDNNYLPNNPYCNISYDNDSFTYQLTFKMNDALLSNISYNYLVKLKELLDSGEMIHTLCLDNKLILSGIIIESNLNIVLLYTDDNDKDYYKVLDRKFKILHDIEKS